MPAYFVALAMHGGLLSSLFLVTHFCFRRDLHCMKMLDKELLSATRFKVQSQSVDLQNRVEHSSTEDQVEYLSDQIGQV